MKKSIVVSAISAALLLGTCAFAENSNVKSLKWTENSLVNVTGTLSQDTQVKSEQVTLTFTDADGEMVYMNQTRADENGNYRFTFKYSGSTDGLNVRVGCKGQPVDDTVKSSSVKSELLSGAVDVSDIHTDSKVTFNYENYFDINDSYYLAAAWYDENGKLIKCTTSDSLSLNDGKASGSLVFTKPEGAAEVKAFAWSADKELTPLAQAASKKQLKFYPNGTTTKKVKINCLGDSITYGYGTDKTYRGFMEEAYDVEAKNYGVGGDTITYVEGQNVGSIVKRHTEMDKDADMVLVFAGTNDVNSQRDLGTIESTDEAHFYGAYKKVVSDLKELYPNKHIVLLTMIHSKWIDSKNPQKYINAIKEIGELYDVPVIDMYQDQFNFGEDIMPDFLHPSRAGHEMMFNYIMEKLTELNIVKVYE